MASAKTCWRNLFSHNISMKKYPTSCVSSFWFQAVPQYWSKMLHLTSQQADSAKNTVFVDEILNKNSFCIILQWRCSRLCFLILAPLLLSNISQNANSALGKSDSIWRRLRKPKRPYLWRHRNKFEVMRRRFAWIWKSRNFNHVLWRNEHHTHTLAYGCHEAYAHRRFVLALRLLQSGLSKTDALAYPFFHSLQPVFLRTSTTWAEL